MIQCGSILKHFVFFGSLNRTLASIVNYINDIFFERVPKTEMNSETGYIFWRIIIKIKQFQRNIIVATTINRTSVSNLNEA